MGEAILEGFKNRLDSRLSGTPLLQGGRWAALKVSLTPVGLSRWSPQRVTPGRLQVSRALPRFGDPRAAEMSGSAVSCGHSARFAVAIPGKFPAPAIAERPQRAGGSASFGLRYCDSRCPRLQPRRALAALGEEPRPRTTAQFLPPRSLRLPPPAG